MTQEKQTLTPAEWKSVSDYLIELSEKVQQATNRNARPSEASPKRGAISEPGNEKS